ncbi:hypothetical protein JJR57_004397, partial [Shigella sonnei]|nr:hypothetical protein [Shigella sonnei]EHL1305147.1 hypothetical protein [Shigella flexneri]
MKVSFKSLGYIFHDIYNKKHTIDEFNDVVRKAVLSGKINELNACHKVAIFLAEKDNEITKKDKAKIIDTLTENYSIEFQQLMNISERTLNSSLYITPGESGFVSFVNREGKICHTAYVKSSDNSMAYYHANYSSIDKYITDMCGLICMRHIESTGIIFYMLDEKVLSAIAEFMNEKGWRAA